MTAASSTQTFGTASIIWGVIGPKLSYSEGGIYYALLFFFLIGALAPIFQWLWTRRYKNSVVRYINFPGKLSLPVAISATNSSTVFFSGTNYFPPAMAVNYVSWGLVSAPTVLGMGVAFNDFARRSDSCSSTSSGDDASSGGRSTTTFSARPWTAG